MLIKKIFFSLLLIIIGWLLGNLINSLKQEKTIPEVMTIEVRKEKITDKVSLTTKVAEKERINITSSVNERVESILVKPGDFVTRGQGLIKLRKEQLINTLKKEELNLETEKKKKEKLTDISSHPEILEKDEEIKRLKWDIKETEQMLEDANELYQRKAAPYRDVEKQETELKKLQLNLNKILREKEGSVKRLEDQRKELDISIPATIWQISELKKQIEGCRIVAPINGIVKKVNVEKNQKVEYGAVLLTISSAEDLVAKGSLKESNFFLVKPGQKVELGSEVLGKRYKGNVLKVITGSSGKEDKSGTKDTGSEESGWEVITSIDTPQGLIPGMELACEIIIKEEKESSVIIPPEVLFEEDTVLVVEKGRIKKKRIKIGESTTEQIEVLEGIRAGDKVVVQYSEEIKEGMKVRER